MDNESIVIDYRGVELCRKELTVLREVDLRIHRGEFVYLVGRVGSGKSTLMKSMYADVPIEKGDAKVLDFYLNGLKRKIVPQLRRSVGMVFQDFQLLTDRDVYHNLRFVLEATGWKDVKAIDERIDEVLKTVGMLTKSYKMPHELSGGEQQRIVIARALLNRPAIILADEPTGNLDPDTGKRIVGVLHEIARGGTAVVMATHNIGFLSQFPATAYRCGEKHLTPFATEAAES